MAGFCDDRQTWCLALALWNGRDPILKERMFGLPGPQGNHGEDVKEYWWFVDGTPTHSWIRWRYHYPQAEFPYDELVAENRTPRELEPEYELVDTGVFDDDRYWASPSTTPRRGRRRPADANHRRERRARRPRRSTCCRRCGTATPGRGGSTRTTPRPARAAASIAGHHRVRSACVLAGDGPRRRCSATTRRTAAAVRGASVIGVPKDGIDDHVIHGDADRQPAGVGTKAALRYRLTVAAGETRTIRLAEAGSRRRPWRRLRRGSMADREAEAEQFYAR